MKKETIRRCAAALLVFSICLLASCSGNNKGGKMTDDQKKQLYMNVFDTVCSADEALESARASNAVVFEFRGCSSGKDVWNEFYGKVSGGSPATVLCAHYYVIDSLRMSEELYEKEKDQYPKLFFYLLEFDGTEFTIKTRLSSEKELDSQQKFKYLRHFTGDAPTASALFSAYDYYVLVDDDTVTMEDIRKGYYSSQIGDYVPNKIVYRDYSGWKEG